MEQVLLSVHVLTDIASLGAAATCCGPVVVILMIVRPGSTAGA